MASCRHEQNWTIVEDATAFTSHTFDRGTLSHHTDLDNLTGMAVFLCYECGSRFRFSTLKPPRKKWLAARLQVVMQRNHSATPPSSPTGAVLRSPSLPAKTKPKRPK
jgi:hypothetical protein